MLPTASKITAPPPAVLPPLPTSWSALTWRQLCDAWQCKMQYGGNADVARAAALLALCGMEPSRQNREAHDARTGEEVYTLQDKNGRLWTVTARELSQIARQTMKWFDFPYGDPGREAVRDENGNVLEEAVAPVPGYVNSDWHDAMQLPEETLVFVGDRMMSGTEWQGLEDKGRDAIHFKLPEVTIRNLTWQQYRTLQFIAPMLFQEGMSDEDVLNMQAQFIAHILVPARQSEATADPFAPKHNFIYDSDRAEQTVEFWKERIKPPSPLKGEKPAEQSIPFRGVGGVFPILFQVYQTAMRYYEKVFPLLFNSSGKTDPLQDALTGETKTINAVMKYQGYTKPEDVYAENLPVIFSTLNTMAEEAKQIEQMNARIKRKK